MSNLLGFVLLLFGLPATGSQTYSRCVAEERFLLSTNLSTVYEARDRCKAMDMRLAQTVNNGVLKKLQTMIRKEDLKN